MVNTPNETPSETVLHFLISVRDPDEVSSKTECYDAISSYANKESKDKLKEVLRFFKQKITGNKHELTVRLIGLVDHICDDEGVRKLVEDIFVGKKCVINPEPPAKKVKTGEYKTIRSSSTI